MRLNVFLRSRISDCLLVMLGLMAGSVRGEDCLDVGTVYPTSASPTGDAPLAVLACDLNNDGFADLITTNDASDTVSVLRNRGDGTFDPFVRWPVGNGGGVAEPVAVACCDFDGDGLADLVVANRTSDTISLLINEGNMQFSAPVSYPVGVAPLSVACTSLNGNTFPDVVVANFTSDTVSVLMNNGDGTLAAHVEVAVGDAPIDLAICDVDGDTVPDVVVANMLGKSVTALHNDGSGGLTSLGSFSVGVNPFGIVCCDLNGNGSPDVATANGIADTVTTLFNNGSGSFGGLASRAGPDGAWDLTCCDIDHDLDLDILTANLAGNDLSLLRNDGAGVLAAPISIAIGSNPSSLTCTPLGVSPGPDLAAAFAEGVRVYGNTCAAGGCSNDKDCDDGIACTVDTCHQPTGVCSNTPDDGLCDDGLFCTGVETCDPELGCQSSGNPCPIPADCSEAEENCSCDAPTVRGIGPRYLLVTPAPSDEPVAILVRGDPEDADVSCVSKYVQAGGLLGDVAFYQLPATWGTVSVRGEAIRPSTSYHVHGDCGPLAGDSLSQAAVGTTWEWGDANLDTVVDIVDITLAVDVFRGAPHAPGAPCSSDADCAAVQPNRRCDVVMGLCYRVTIENTDLASPINACLTDRVLDITDIVKFVDAFSGRGYNCPDVCP